MVSKQNLNLILRLRITNKQTNKRKSKMYNRTDFITVIQELESKDKSILWNCKRTKKDYSL
jgi:hypothetical protein